MRLNAIKCKVMYFGGSEETRKEYTMVDLTNGSRGPLAASECERDLGIQIASDLRWSNHVNTIVSKANRVLGMLLKTFTSRDKDLWKLLYVSLVRPHLEFASTVWNPYLKGDIEALEKVQRKASKIPSSMRGLDHEERLKMWGLTTLEERRTRGDLIQMYKVRNGLEDIGWCTGPQYLPPPTDDRPLTRDASHNKYRLKREKFSARSCNDFGHQVTVRNEFFLNRVVGNWNKLASSQIEAQSLNIFKARIDK